MGGFRQRGEKASTPSEHGGSVIDLSPRVPARSSQPADFEDEADLIDQVAQQHGYRSDEEPFKPKLRRRIVDEPQDVITTQARRSIVDKFDMWCARNGFTKKAGFEEMVKRVTRRA